MKRFVILALLAGCTTLSVAEEMPVSPPIDHIEKAFMRRAVGVIDTIDLNRHTLQLKEKNGSLTLYTITQRTRASAKGKRVPLPELKPGDRVTLHYVDGTTFIRKILLL